MATDNAALAEAFLFTEGGSLTLKRLATLTHLDEQGLKQALQELSESLRDRGLSLVVTETEASLAVSPRSSETVRTAYKEELGRDIGDAGLEVLAIVLYRGASTRSNIDYIRGVNTSSTIRNLMARGLLERIGNPDDAREYLYRPTTELLAHLGVRTREELPEHATLSAEIAAFESKPQESSDTSHGIVD